MNSAHNSTSPVSPYSQRSSQQSNSYFFSRQDSSPNHTQSQAGLGLYPLAIPQTSQQLSVRTASPTRDPAWSQTSAEQQSFSAPVSSQQEMYSTSPYDTFSNFTPQNQQHQHQSSLSSPEAAPGLDYCQSATSSDMPSHRSSVCSYTSEASEMNLAARAKVDEQRGGWYTTQNDHSLSRAMTSPGQISFTSHAPTLMPHQTEDLYRPNAQAEHWATQDHKGYVSEISSSSGSTLQTFDMPVLPSVTRVKKKRQRTTPEEATHECRVCHKLFKRSYNWKSHMETHNPDRKYPHPCTAMVGNQQCSKKFQRKTDLDRHYDSVHLKARNHKCHLCGNRFARRDTLRRHTEDGCPKRFELGLRDATNTPVQPQHTQQVNPVMPHHMQQPVTQRPGWSFASQVTMAPPMMQPNYLTANTFPAHTMPPPSAVPYQA